MSRLIDADRLLRPEIVHLYYHLPNGDIAIPIIDIERAPTAVTNCKKCLLSQKRGFTIYCEEWNRRTEPTGFCHKGQPRTANLSQEAYEAAQNELKRREIENSVIQLSKKDIEAIDEFLKSATTEGAENE